VKPAVVKTWHKLAEQVKKVFEFGRHRKKSKDKEQAARPTLQIGSPTNFEHLEVKGVKMYFWTSSLRVQSARCTALRNKYAGRQCAAILPPAGMHFGQSMFANGAARVVSCHWPNEERARWQSIQAQRELQHAPPPLSLRKLGN
jgi:hypothetical protein